MVFITNLLKEQKNSQLIKKLLPWTIYALLPIALFRLYFHPIHLPDSSINQTPQIILSSSSSSSFSPSSVHKEEQEVNAINETPCDFTDGKWVPDNSGPLYNGSTCATIKPAQNCLAHGRRDLGYLYWRWKPYKCDLPRFDPSRFLHLMNNKHIAFIGDSMARNQLESLLCILSSVSTPNLVYRNGEDNKFRRWNFPSHNVTVSVYWSPFLVDGIEKSNPGPNLNKLFLHRVNEKWAADLDDFNAVVFSIGHWYLHPAVYYDGDDSVMGCHYCPGLNHTEVGFYDALRKALRTTFQTVIDRRSPASEVDVFLATFSPSHFEGAWDKAGACPKTMPFEEAEKKLEGMDGEIRGIEIEEVEEGKSRAKQSGGLRIESLDVTKLSLLRGDGHPGPYMNPFPFGNGGGGGDRVQNDCVHWCLPGPVDTWNEILLQIMNNWEKQSSRGR